jgi:hypothetical protein
MHHEMARPARSERWAVFTQRVQILQTPFQERPRSARAIYWLEHMSLPVPRPIKLRGSLGVPMTLQTSHGDHRDNFECSKQGRTSLSTTSNTPRFRPRISAGRTQVRHDYESSAIPDLGHRQADLGKTAGIVGMALLIGMTSWVVASVSTWLVAIYVTAMFLIFAVPRTHYIESRKYVRDNTKREDYTKHSQEPVVSAISDSSSEPLASLAIRICSEVSTAETESLGSVAKPRRIRGRGRKPTKPGTEPSVALEPTTWIQVAPGKFVRADSQAHGLAAAPEPEAFIQPAEASTGAEDSPPEALEDNVLERDLALVNALAEVNPSEPGSSSELDDQFIETVTVADPHKDSPLDDLEQNTTSSARDCTIAPSVFSSSPQEVPMEEANYEQSQPGLLVPPGHVAENLARAGIESSPVESSHPGSTCSGGSRRMSGHARSPLRRNRFKPVPCANGIQSLSTRSRSSKYLRIGFAHSHRWSATGLGTVPCQHTRTLARRDYGCSRQIHRRYQPRSPPSRS